MARPRTRPVKPPPLTPPKPVAEGGYKRFTDLPLEQQTAMESMLQKGDSGTKVATFMQTEWGLFPDIKTDTLKKQLERYRDKVLIPRWDYLQAKVEKGRVGANPANAPGRARIGAALNVLEHYDEIIEIQRTRILKVWKKEQSLPEGVVLDSLTKLLKDYNHSLHACANLQLETGLLKRAPKVISGTLGFNDPNNPNAEPVFEVAFRAQQEARQGVAELASLLEHVIEGEYERVESSGGALPAPPADEPARRGGAAQRPAEDSVPPAGGHGARVPAGRGGRGSRPTGG